MKHFKFKSVILLSSFSALTLTACSSTELIVPIKNKAAVAISIEDLNAKEQKGRFAAMAQSVPESYKAIRFDDLNWNAPKAESFRTKLSKTATLYAVEDKSLPWVHFKMILNILYMDLISI